MSFDLITPELDNHPIIRTMLNVCIVHGQLGVFRRCLRSRCSSTELCRFVVTMCNAQRLWCAVCTCARLMNVIPPAGIDPALFF